MKTRNQLLALVCLALFLGFGVLYFRTWVVQKPFGIILFTADGLDLESLTAARLYAGGADQRLTMHRFPHVAILHNASLDSATPDTIAAATALATGRKTANGQPAGTASILELARGKGRSAGLVSTSSLTGPGASPFYGKELAALDVALGGGVLAPKQVELVRSKAQLENAANYRAQPFIGLFAEGDLPWSTQVESGSQTPSLSDMTRRAIQMLQLNTGGYVLVVDAALVGRAASQNRAEQTLTEILDLDRAIATAMKYAGDNTLIIVAGRASLGGLALNGHQSRKDYGVALMGTSPGGSPTFTWATGPNGPNPEQPQPPGGGPAAFYEPTAAFTAGDVPAMGTGPGAERLSGFLENTVVFDILREAL